MEKKMDIQIGESGCSIELIKCFYFRGEVINIGEWCSAHNGKISTTQLAEIVERKKSRVRRHVRELLGRDPNPKGGKGTGYARLLTKKEAIEVYIYGLLIRYMPQKEIRHTIKLVTRRISDQEKIMIGLKKR